MNYGLCLKIGITIFIFIQLNNYLRRNIEYIYEKIHIKIMRQTSAECTLFLNKNDEFPIYKPCNVLLIGSGARNTIKGGLGSADTEPRYYTTCEEGLEKAGFKITTKEWLSKYPFLKEEKIDEHINFIKDMDNKNKVSGTYRMVSFPEYEYDLKINEEIKADIAIYVLARNSGEGMDRRLIKGDILMTDTEIKDILYLNQKYKKFMLVLNVGGVVDLSPVKEVSNILLLSQLGIVTGDILADIILGKANPSGKLTTTWASVNDYKFLNEFGDINDVNYKEGVYVGYRYFDSDNIKPLYPFGYGKSYTSFEISKISLSNINDEIIIKVRVKNVGKFKGKEVIQVYVSPSQENKDKPFQSLVAFQKTNILNPSRAMNIILNFKLRSIARYDEDTACYILDKGKYIIRVGNSSQNTKVFGYIELNEDIIIEQLKNITTKTDFIDYKPNITINDDFKNTQRIVLKKENFEFKKIEYNYTIKINEKIKNLKEEELAYLCIGGYIDDPNEINEKERGPNGLTTKKIKEIKKYLIMNDGPAGLRLVKASYLDSQGYHRLNPNPVIFNSYQYLFEHKKIPLSLYQLNEDYSNYKNVIYQYATAFPIPTAMGQTFNEDLIEKYGDIIGKEMEIYNINLWLAPAMNIHRNILNGRNFEYFSEDPLVTGKMAAAIVRGVQSHKYKGTTLKHFAGNNQETNRLNNNSKMSERALREIYLKGFQIAIEESKPTAVMTSYNLINGIHPAENFQLLIDVLRNEWNFNGLVMTDWLSSGLTDFKTSIHPSQYVYKAIKAGNNIMMPGSKIDYDLILEKLNEKILTRDDLLNCASKVYETIELLNK